MLKALSVGKVIAWMTSTFSTGYANLSKHSTTRRWLQSIKASASPDKMPHILELAIRHGTHVEAIVAHRTRDRRRVWRGLFEPDAAHNHTGGCVRRDNGYPHLDVYAAAQPYSQPHTHGHPPPTDKNSHTNGDSL